MGTRLPRAVRLLCLVVGGALALSACDQIHVHFGVLSYPHPVLAGQAWWVPLEFALATAAICVGTRPFARRLPEPSAATFATATLWFVGAYAASGVFQRWPLALAAAYLLTWAGRVAVSRERAAVGAYSLLLAAAGTAVEAVISSTGAFAYAHPDLVLVPIWLPGLYLHGAPLALALTRGLVVEPRVSRARTPGAPDGMPRPA
jgi:hypothetical protein